MNAQSLAKIRSLWLQRLAHALARENETRQMLFPQLERLLDNLEQAVSSGNPAWLDPILLEWMASSTLAELQQKGSHIANLVQQVIATTNEVILESLPMEQALELLSAMTPFYVYAMEKVVRLQMEARLAYVSAELVEAQKKLERLDRSKSNFISVAAHELKTPLTLVEGYAAMLGEAARGNEQQIGALINGIHLGVQRLRKIVDDMIDVSLIDNNLLSLNLQPIQLGHLLSLLERSVREAIRERQQVLEIRNFPGAEIWIYADGERLHQALYNILVNAIKYTPDHGRITISGRTLPGFIEVTISDTGIGISAEDQRLIFEKFEQTGHTNLHSSGSTKFKGGGPGLGLSIARGIIEAHGGTIWVESPGYDEVQCPGSTFHILIPLRIEAADARLARLLGNLRQTQSTDDEQKDPPPHTPPA